MPKEMPPEFQLDGWSFEGRLRQDDIDLVLDREMLKQMKCSKRIQGSFPIYPPERIHNEIAAYVAKSPRYRSIAEFYITGAMHQLAHEVATYPDGYNGQLGYRTYLLISQAERALRKENLELTRIEMAELKESREVDGMRELYTRINIEYTNQRSKAPQSYLDELEGVMGELERLIDASVSH